MLSQNLFPDLTSEVNSENTGKGPQSVSVPSMSVFLSPHFLSPGHPRLLTFMCVEVQRLQKNVCPLFPSRFLFGAGIVLVMCCWKSYDVHFVKSKSETGNSSQDPETASLETEALGVAAVPTLSTAPVER